MTQYIIAYIATAISFALIDLLWLGYIAKNFYMNQIGYLMEFNYVGVVMFYLVYIAGIIFFAIAPALAITDGSNQWKLVLFMGCLFGFFAYATYDLTNLAVTKDWPYLVTFVDIAWGTILTGSAATAGYLITRIFTA